MRNRWIANSGTALLELLFIGCLIAFVIAGLPSIFHPANVDLNASSASTNKQLLQMVITANGRELWIQRGLDNVISLDVATRQIKPVFARSERAVGAWSVSRDGATVLLAKDEREFLVYRDQEVVVDETITDERTLLAGLSSDGSTAVRIVGGTRTRSWDLSTPEPTSIDVKLLERADRLGIDPAGHFFVVASLEGVMHFYNTKSGECLGEIEAHGMLKASPSFSGDGRWFAIIQGSAVVVYNTQTVKEAWRIQSDKLGGYHCAEFSPDGKWIAISGRNAGTCVLDAATGGFRREIPTDVCLQRVCFSTSGNSLYLGGADGSITLWSIEDQKARKLISYSAEFQNSSQTPIPLIAVR